MIKYYSTLEGKFYDSKRAAQIAEDAYVEKYFEDMDMRLAAKKRKLRRILQDDQSKSLKITIK